jgi:hypothetical protein
MSLPEGAVVAIILGLRFVGQRLDPRSFLPLMTTPPEIPPHEPDLLEDRRDDAFKAIDMDEEGMRGLTDQIRKAIEGEEGIWMMNNTKTLLITGFIIGLLLGLLLIYIRGHQIGSFMQIELLPPPIKIPVDFLTA